MKIATKKKNGQVALIVLIVSAVVMTVGLSISKKSTVETKITTDQELLKQAFNAAESGIDYYLATGQKNYTATDNRSQAEVKVNEIGGGSRTFNLGEITLRNENSYTWLVGHRSDGSIDTSVNMLGVGLTACVDNDFDGALKVDYFYVSGGTYGVYRAGYNVVTGGRVSGYSNVTPITNSCGSGKKAITLNGVPGGVTPLLLVIKPIADDTNISVVASGGANFPSQAMEISSTGRAGDVSAGATANASRTVNIVNQYQIPAFMIDAVTAGGNVLSN